MSKAGRNIVPFERPAAYWATRARRHYTPAKLPDAALLMRKALEKSGDPALALELARIYGAMDCPTAAERNLLRAVARGGLTADACFVIASCALARDQEELAENALEACLRLDPAGVFADQAQELLETHPWPGYDVPPRCARSAVLCGRAREALAAGRIQEAQALANRAWKKGKTWQGAVLMGSLQQTPQEGVPYFVYAAQHCPGKMQPRLLLAHACFLAGDAAAARRHLALARLMADGISQAEGYCLACWQMGMPEEALSLCKERLERSPSSVDYLRLKYLSLRQCGDAEGAGRALSTLLELDPDDAGGIWYRRHPEDTRMYAGQLMLLPALAAQVSLAPRRLQRGALNRTLHMLVLMLQDSLTPEQIYRAIPVLWRQMTKAQKAACDERRDGHWPLVLSAYALIRSGMPREAASLLAAAPGRKRAMRALKHFLQGSNEE